VAFCPGKVGNYASTISMKTAVQVARQGIGTESMVAMDGSDLQ